MGALKAEHLDDFEEEPTHPPSQNAYCEDGEEWLERQREADLEHQKEEQGNASKNP